MGVNAVRYPKTTVGREKTAALWNDAMEAYADLPEVGSYYFEDFDTPFPTPADAAASPEVGYFIQDAAAGGTVESFTNVASPHGLARLSATTGTDHFGIEAHRGSSATSLGSVHLPTHPTDPQGEVIFETYCDFDLSDNWFIGLTEPIVEFLSSVGVLPTDSDYIGFQRIDDGNLLFVTGNDNNGGTAVIDSAIVILAAAVPTGLTKLGFRVNRDQSVDIFVDGVSYPTPAATINALALPIEALTQKFATTRGATGDLATLVIDIDWVATWVAAL